jgi:hypothetical protein
MNLSDALLESVFRIPRGEPVQEVELSPDWKEFEEILCKYKQVYKETVSQFKLSEIEIFRMKTDIQSMQQTLSVVHDPLIQEELVRLIDVYKERNEFEKKKAENAQLAGKIKSMDSVLVYTGHRKYAQFTCSICMERLIDTFLDPCGHVMCEQCTTRINRCPMCRTQVVLKKIYSTM